MKRHSKYIVALGTTALAAGAIASPFVADSGTVQTDLPTMSNGNIKRAPDPVSMQLVACYDGKHIVKLGPVIPYVKSPFQGMRVGSIITDTFEGNSTTNGNPDVPNERLDYGDYYGMNGSRWYYGDTAQRAYVANFFIHSGAGMLGKGATGADFEVHVSSTAPSPLTHVILFTVDSVTAPFSTTTGPTGWTGVDLNYGAGIAAGSTVYSNIDLSTFNAGAGLTMPTTADGYQGGMLLSSESPNVQAIASFMYWGTKPLNPSLMSWLGWRDANFNGVFDATGEVFSYQSGKYGTAASYTATRGVETSTNAATNIQGTAGVSATIQQRKQVSTALNNAELTAVVTLDPATAATNTLKVFHAEVIAKANPVPLANATSAMTVQMFNYTTGSYTTLWSGKPTNPGTDGDFILSASVPTTNPLGTLPIDFTQIPQYVFDDGLGNRSSTVRVGVKQTKPTSPNWSLSVNWVTVHGAVNGPDPIAPAISFSSTL